MSSSLFRFIFRKNFFRYLLGRDKKQMAAEDKSKQLESIKSTAKQVGLSEAALRKYEKYGIVHPAAKNEAGYRFYDGLNVSRLISCKRLRQCGFSLEETTDLLNHADLDDVGDALKQRAEEIAGELLWRQRLLTQINAMREEIVNFPSVEGQYEIAERPDFYCLEQKRGEKLSKKQWEAVKNWTDLIPVVRLTVFVRRDTEYDSFQEKSFGYTISGDSLDMLDDSDREDLRLIPAGRFLTTTVVCSTDQKYLTEMVPAALSYLTERGIAYDPEIIMDTIVCTGSRDAIKVFRRLWVRIID